MLSCRDIAARADDIVDHAGSWRERLAFRLHLMMCERCRRFIAQYRRLSALVSRVEQPASDAEIARVLESVRMARERPQADGRPMG